MGTFFERFTGVARVNGKGTIPDVLGIIVSAVVAFIGYKLVGGAMHRNHLIKG